jgi:hypothetical protein
VSTEWLLPDLPRDCFRPVALIADGTFEPHMSFEDRQAYETGAMLALVAGGVWKRHAAVNGEIRNRQLDYVGWHEVRQQLHDDGRGPLAELFDAFFKDGRYEEKLKKLLKKIYKRDWGFTSDWEQVRKPQPHS